MKCIIDTNILISALIKDSSTRKIICTKNWEFYYPEVSFHEVRKYKDLVLKKSGMNNKDYQEMIDKLLTKIILVPDENILPHIKESKKELIEIDPDDVVFLACGLAETDSIIWSDDKHLKQQKQKTVFTTKEIISTFFY